MLTQILATDDPYEAAAAFVKAGWSLVFQTPPDSGDPLACVALAGAQLMLGTSMPEFLPAESRAHKGAGVEFHIIVPSTDIAMIYEAHRRHAESVSLFILVMPRGSPGGGWPRRVARRARAAAELAEDPPVLEQGICPFTGGAELRVGAVGPAASSSCRTPQIHSAFLSCTEPGSAQDTHRMSPLGLAMTCRFIPWRLCLPE